MAIEKNAKEVVNTHFANELKNGTVVFKTVDISTPEGEKIADKYEVTCHLSLSINGKAEKRAETTSLSLASVMPVTIQTASKKVLLTKSGNR